MNKFIVRLPSGNQPKKDVSKPRQTNQKCQSTQAYLDLGQKSLGTTKKCNLCSMFYVIDDEDDVRSHTEFCKKVRRLFLVAGMTCSTTLTTCMFTSSGKQSSNNTHFNRTQCSIRFWRLWWSGTQGKIGSVTAHHHNRADRQTSDRGIGQYWRSGMPCENHSTVSYLSMVYIAVYTSIFNCITFTTVVCTTGERKRWYLRDGGQERRSSWLLSLWTGRNFATSTSFDSTIII